MSEKGFEEIWEEFNSIEIEESLHYSNVSLISNLINISPKDKKEDMQKESALGWLIHIISNWLDHSKLDPKKVNDEIEIFLSKHRQDLEYYKKRLVESKTILLKWHYTLACYFIEKGTYLTSTIKLILKSAQMALDVKNYFNGVQLLYLAYNLNKIFNVKLDNEINNVALIFVEKTKETPRYLIEPIEILSKLNIISSDEYSKLVELTEDFLKLEEIKDVHIITNGMLLNKKLVDDLDQVQKNTKKKRDSRK